MDGASCRSTRRISIRPQDVASGRISHWECFKRKQKKHPYKVVIPSFNRPQSLCLNTLGLLKAHGVPTHQVAVFVSPKNAPGQTEPEWYRYLSTLKAYGYNDVQVLPGGVGLEQQLAKAMAWADGGYVIVMSDTVQDVLMKLASSDPYDNLRPLPKGSLPAIWEHAAHLMTISGCMAWSVNPSHRTNNLHANRISRKLGFLDGNMMGMFLPDKWSEYHPAKGHGMIYHVELSAGLWDHGYRFFRYMDLCVKHPYRGPGGQSSVFLDPLKRRRLENAALKKVAKKYRKCIKWCSKPQATLMNMQYKFLPLGEGPLTMVRRKFKGRRLVHHKCKASSSTERMRVWRRKQIRARR
jgi:hypothetical protein